MTRALAALAALLAASCAFGGEEDADFAASKGSAAEARLHERLRAAVRAIPGTDTQYLVGGYLQIDAIAMRKRQLGDEQNTFFASAIPFGTADRAQRLSGRQSQFNWLSRTPTGAGNIDTRIEANLFPLDGTTAFTLNQLYLRWAEHLVVGKTYSTFMDEDALPTTLDYNGPAGVIFARQWLARGSLKLGSGWSLQAALEDAQSDLAVRGAVLGLETSADRPDVAARVRYEGEGGHFQLAGLSRRASIRATSPAGTRERHLDGSGVSASGSLSVLEDDTLLFQAVTGRGVGRYFNDPISATGAALNADGTLVPVRTSGTTLYYQHKWAPDWMTVAGASTLWLGDEGLQVPGALRRISYASLNLIHRVSPTLLVGAEGLWGEAIRRDGTSSTNARLQLSLRYLIF